MSQGCHLIFSAGDREQFKLEIPPRGDDRIREAILRDLGLEVPAAEEVVSARGSDVVIDRALATKAGLGSQAECFESRTGNQLPDGQAVIAEVLATYPRARLDTIAGLGNTLLSEPMARALPGAIGEILRHTPGAAGLFTAIRKGESSWISNLKNTNPGSADGIAYEVLATRQLMKGRATSVSGTLLQIVSSDYLAFGPKVQGWYGQPGPIGVQDGPRRSVFYQPRRKTAEADLLIRRETEEIAVDFKHSQRDVAIDVPREEIEAVWTSLRTGEVTRFCFVSNRTFSPRTVKIVEEINRKIDSDDARTALRARPIELFERFSWDR